MSSTVCPVHVGCAAYACAPCAGVGVPLSSGSVAAWLSLFVQAGSVCGVGKGAAHALD